MKLTLEGIKKDRDAFLAAGYRLPAFDYSQVAENTQKRPVWIHFGAGNIFKAFQANVLQTLLNEGVMDTGLIAAEGYDYEIIEKSSRPHDNLSILATLKADNTVEKTVVGSIMRSYVLDSKNQAEFSALKRIFSSPSLQMASFTITEKGYSLTDAKGRLLSAVSEDFASGPQTPDSYLGKVVSLLYARYLNGKLPIAMVSMDNCSHNGDKLYAAVTAYADAWCDKGLAEAGFSAYVRNPLSVSFPWTMIDKITPRPDARVEALLKEDGLEELDPVVTSKNTYIAPFVNAEECEYLVIEDSFPNGRPPLDKGGIIFTDRETVDKVEKMKVCTCLNPLHTTLAIFGCLLGYTLISQEMKNPLLKKLVEQIGYKEGLPVVVDPGIIEPKAFIDEVVNVRIPNPFLPDTPQRIATDTSQKLAIRFGETIKAYEKNPSLDTADLKYIPLVFAGWLRYLMGVDDQGSPFALSPDPLLESVTPYVSGFSLGQAQPDLSALDGLLANEKIFGVDLTANGMDGLVKKYFSEMLKCPGAVNNVLEKYVQ
ncbi:MAG TPA: mannitol dehydrogenase family protein [Candidatus Acetatifactor stercoripullorum]|uniref:Mannitol dehydrogenase family protein n=1 Tax=Candidatus Acetatifactor stercoripullorum TaxID=2838414 RepID=A0A9D1R6N8_9FIRM|nr:mannitol dehydrogenase family protein [uncultured Acetatifactor sp.]HIW82022.1 mannitol dehydrogenase family protein [Candidatus Acetatifactor stercoripullorum]